MHALDRVGDVERPYFGIMSISWNPTPWLRVGGNRTSVFGGENMPAVNLRRVVHMLLGRHSHETGEFENQLAQLFATLRLAPAGFPLLLYGAYAVNDTEGGVRDDPAALLGAMVPLAPPGWLGALRYEYVGFGPRVSLCSWCEHGRIRYWYDHYRYGKYWVDGALLGSSLGGYGYRHRIRWQGWAGDIGPWSLSFEGFIEKREELNILHDRWPGHWTGASAALSFRPHEHGIIDLHLGQKRGRNSERESEIRVMVQWSGLRN